MSSIKGWAKESQSAKETEGRWPERQKESQKGRCERKAKDWGTVSKDSDINQAKDRTVHCLSTEDDNGHSAKRTLNGEEEWRLGHNTLESKGSQF